MEQPPRVDRSRGAGPYYSAMESASAPSEGTARDSPTPTAAGGETVGPPVPPPLRLTAKRAVLLSALLALLLSAPTLGHDFVYDDMGVILAREALWEVGLREVLTEPYWPQERSGALWRPTTLALFSAQWSLGDGNPAVFHATNILLYSGVSALVALLGALLFSPGVGLVAGLVFAAHPVHVEVTANVVGQSELLSAAAYLGVLALAWTSLRRPPSVPVLLGVGLLAFVGMGAKEHVVTLPGAVLLLWWWGAKKRKEGPFEVAARQWPVLAAVTLGVIAYLAVRFLIRGEFADSGGVAPGLDPDSILQRVVVMLPVSLHWIRLFFWPVQLSADYGPAFVPVRAEPGWIHAAAAATWIGLLVAAWAVRDRIPAVTMGAAFFLVTIAVASNILVPIEIRLAERLLFLPSVGWALAMGGLAVAVGHRSHQSRLFVAIVVAFVTLAFSVRTLDRNPVWKDNDTFFAQMELDAPGTFRISWIKAERSLELGDDQRAEFHYREALERNPYNPTLAEHLGRFLMRQGRHGEAVPLFIQALESDIERESALQGLATALVRSGRGLEALRWLDWLEELHGEDPLSTVLRIEALRLAGRFEESVRLAETVLRDRPEDWSLHLLAAQSARLGGLCDTALRHVDEGLLRAPEEGREALREIRASILAGEIECVT
jgi:protein O-mannosyl-transferase